jgi:hypothetical protein
LVIGLDSSARTLTILPPATSMRMPQLWLQRTQTLGRLSASRGRGVFEIEGSTALVEGIGAPFDFTA